MIRPEPKSCWFCKEPIYVGAKRCKHCTAYQKRRRRWIPLASTLGMLAPLMAVVTALVAAVPFAGNQCNLFRTRHSATSIDFAGARATSEPVVIYAQLLNKGRQPSSVLGYRLNLNAIHVDAVPLLPNPDDKHEIHSVVQPNSGIDVPLAVSGLRTAKGYSVDDAFRALPRADGVLCANIDESTGREWRCVRFPAELLRNVLIEKLVKGAP